MDDERIAIVGIACRYPDAPTTSRLWASVLHRRVAFRRIPEERLSADYLAPGDDEPDHTYVTHAAVLRDWEFDRARFTVPGLQYRAADLTHWLALEVASDVLADAGHPGGAGIDRDRVGVILGNSLTGEFNRAGMLRLRWPFVRRAAAEAMAAARLDGDVCDHVLEAMEQRFKAPFPAPDDETLAGGLSNTIAGRICNHYDFHGTGYTVDGACASSLLAVSAARDALLRGDLDLAIAGGVDLSLDPFELVGFARMGALSRGGMRVYDAEPTGFLPGEGCGMVALMRAGDAQRRQARVYAHLLGAGTSSDGAGGLTRPAQRGQALAARRAYERAGVDPADVALLEGHGTGTPVGDRVELEVLSGLRAEARAPAALGSIKANIGHTKAAAGVAGLLKTALALHHRVLPPTTGCDTPHALLRGSAALRVLDRPEPWGDRPVLAGVSASGFGGINTHVVLEGAARSPRRRLSLHEVSGTPAPRHQVAVIAARDPATTARQLERLSGLAGRLSTAELLDCTAALAEAADLSHTVRVAMTADTPQRLVEQCAHALAFMRDLAETDQRGLRSPAPGVHVGWGPPAAVGLLFPSQGAPLDCDLGVLEGLLGPASRQSCAEFLRRIPRAPMDGGAAPADTALAQPTIVAASLAALLWLDELGVVARAALGHSLGELAALAWAGVLTREDALSLAVTRGALMGRHGRAGGGMTGLAASAPEAEALLEGTGVVLAGLNGPRQTVVAGPLEELERVQARAAERGISCAPLGVSHAFHSPAMAPVRDPFRAALREVGVRPPAGQVVSSITGRVLRADDDLRALLVDQLTGPVRFDEALARLAAECQLLVEVGPGRILTGLAAGTPAVVATELDGAGAGLAACTAAVTAAGAVTSLAPWFAGRHVRRFDLDRPPVFLASPCEAEPVAGPVTRTQARAGSPRPAETSPASADLPVTAVEPGQTAVDADPLATLRRSLAAALELDERLVAPEQRLLRDLHLSSLQVVQLVGGAADALGRAHPTMPLSLADATVADVAELLAGLPEADAADDVAPPGAGPWTRAYRDVWEPTGWAVDPASPATYAWRVQAVGAPPAWVPPAGPEGRPLALLVALGAGAAGDLAGVADACRAAAELSPERVVVVSPDGAGAALARSVFSETSGVAVVSLRCPSGARFLDRALAAVCGRDEAFLDLRLTEDGEIMRRAVRLHALPATAEGVSPLEPGDVCLVTGGADGITAACAAALAERSGCHLVVVGRRPADDPEVARAVARLAHRVPSHYVAGDLSDPESAAAVVAAAGAHGTVRGILHGAGYNVPGPLGEMTPEALGRTLAPKVGGLANLLAALDPAELRLLVGFGSIIGRMGLAGQTSYCVANDWLRLLVEEFAAARPACRVRLVEWSIWSGIGMGVRMGVLDDLARRGVAAIGPDVGVDLFLRTVEQPEAPVTTLVTGRYPATPTVDTVNAPPPFLRFLERMRVLHPGVEVVADAQLSIPGDPFLDDHRIDGLAVLPAVVSLEALAQVATAVDPSSSWRGFSDVSLPAPVIVEEDRPRVVRAVALADDQHGDRIRAALRSDEDRFSLDRANATVWRGRKAAEPVEQAAPPPPLDGPHPLYGTLLFHRGRFSRLRGYAHVSAHRCHAWVDADPGPLFSAFLPQDLILGDPRTHDACIHVLQACLPHQRLLPVRIEELAVQTLPTGVLQIRAVQRDQRDQEYCFDLDVADPAGLPAASWRGLWLRAVGPLPATRSWRLELVGPRVARRCEELGLAGRVDAVTDRVSADADTLLSFLAGGPLRTWRTPEGRLRCEPGSASVSRSPAGIIVARSATHEVGADWAVAAPGDTWLPRLDPVGRELALAVGEKVAEDPELSALRVWTAREALVKAGLAPDLPLVVQDVSDADVVVSSGDATVVTAALSVDEATAPVVVAVAVAGPS